MKNCAFGLICLLAVSGVGRCAEPVDYLQHIKPILSARCFSCHGALRDQSGLRLDAASLIFEGGDSGPAVVPGRSESSLLIKKVTGTDDETLMPPEDEGEPLSEKEVSLLKAWIDQGALAPSELIPDDPRRHWAYQLPVKAALPNVNNAAWQLHPIDSFLSAAQEKQRLVPRPPATREVWLRRVYFDLIGLPPSREELHTFLADSSDNAYDAVVTRLLDSPRHGERWARHWMDIWRYSDWFGLAGQVRYSQKHIWRWRDWIIESLNENKGYDRMIVEMLAGDELDPANPDTLRATGFLTRNWYLFNRNYWLDDVIEHTSKAFLGLTFNCVRCHEHKYDPISHDEYYRFRAFFEPHRVRLDAVPGNSDLDKDGLSRVFDQDLDAKTYLFTRGDEERPEKDRPLSPAVPVVLGDIEEIQPVRLPLEAWYPSLRPEIQRDMVASAEAAVCTAEADVQTAETKLDTARNRHAAVQARSERGAGSESPSAESELFSGADSIAESFLADDFAGPRPELWKQIRGEIEYSNGRLLQTSRPGERQTQLRSVELHPPDFTATLRFRIVGGQTRSIGLAFDVDDRGLTGVFMSPTDPKVQIYTVMDGRESYPAGARKTIPVNNLQEYKLKVAVRDRLVNVWVDGEFQFAHELASSRRRGRFAVTSYQASVELLSVSVTSLAADVRLAQAGDQPTDSAQGPEALEAAVTAAEQSVELKKKKLEAARREFASVRARLAAENAKFAVPPTDAADDMALAAGRAEREATVTKAEVGLLTARQALKANDKNLQKAVATAKKKLTEARAKLESLETESHESRAKYSPPGPRYPETSTGRRLALARWIAGEHNPLTARVAVNHIWSWHFGEPLVPSMFDFGLRSKQPPHHELLDWLAVEFMESGWSMKHLHRLIVTSQAWRMESSAGSADNPNQEIDPDNRFLWRMNSTRMQAEIIRDSLLSLVGRLHPASGGADLPVKEAKEGTRRTIYYRYARDDKIRFLDVFDAPSVEECYDRRETIVPQQALAMINSEMVLSRGRELAALIGQEVGHDGSPGTSTVFIIQSFERILGRAPTTEEQAVCEISLRELEDALATKENARLRARENLVHVLLNHNDYVTVR